MSTKCEMVNLTAQPNGLMRQREKGNKPMANWPFTLSQLDIYFEGRLKLELNV